MIKMPTNKITNQKYFQLLLDAWDTDIQLTDKSQCLQKNYQKFIKFSVKYNKDLNKDLDLRYGIDRIEQNKCIIGDYNKKVILPSFRQNVEFHSSGLSNKIFHHASLIHAWLKGSIRLLNWKIACCYDMIASKSPVAVTNLPEMQTGAVETKHRKICQASAVVNFEFRRLIFIN